LKFAALREHGANIIEVVAMLPGGAKRPAVVFVRGIYRFLLAASAAVQAIQEKLSGQHRYQVDQRCGSAGTTTIVPLPSLPLSPLAPSAPGIPVAPVAPLSAGAPCAPGGPAGPGTATTTGGAGVTAAGRSHAPRASVDKAAANTNKRFMMILPFRWIMIFREGMLQLTCQSWPGA